MVAIKMLMSMTGIDQIKKRAKLMGRPSREAMPETMTLAEAPIKVPLPPKQAPNDKAHQTGIIAALPPKLSSIDFSIGIMVATKGILSTMAEKKADIHKMTNTVFWMLPLVAAIK